MNTLRPEEWRNLWPKSAYAGRAIYPPGGSLGPRMQRYVQLVAMHAGSLDLHLDGERRRYGPGHLVWLIPGQRLYFEFSKTEESWHSWIDYYGAAPDQVLRLLEANPSRLAPNHEIERLLSDAVNWQISGRQTQEELVRSAAYQVLLIYLDEASRGLGAGSPPHPSVLQVMRHAANHLSQNITLADLAARASVTPEHLCRLFAQSGYPSPMAWLWGVRIRHGLGMLRSTGLSVEEIARQCGFRSPFHFSRKVKEATGLSPTEYRRR